MKLLWIIMLTLWLVGMVVWWLSRRWGTTERGKLRELSEVWGPMADRLGLDLELDLPGHMLRMRGRLEREGGDGGAELSVERIYEGTSDGRRYFTVIRADLLAERLPEGLWLETQAGSQWVLQFGDRDDIIVGEDVIDDHFVIRGDFKQQVRDFFWQEEVEEAFRGLADLEEGWISLEDGVLECTVPGEVRALPRMRRYVEAVAGVHAGVRAAAERERGGGDDVTRVERELQPENWSAPE